MRARRAMRLASPFTIAIAAAAVAAATAACSSDDEGGDPDRDPIAWVSPTSTSRVPVGDPVELTVKVADSRATTVQFIVDGELLATCDASDECRRGDLFKTTTRFGGAGRRHLVAIASANGLADSAAIDVEVVALASAEAEADAGSDAPADGGGSEPPSSPPPPPPNRGFLDPDRPLHNVFGGVSWAVKAQKVTVVAPPAGSVTAVASCMQRYGASITKWADAMKVSRASVVATAITESNCTNPTGSSDGLSSGPMQVTGSTCASVAGGGISSAACKTKMHANPDYSFEIGARYMGSSYQRNQHGSDPPKIAAAYNAGSIRSSTANRWHMVVTGNHIERFVGAYNAYRAWETSKGVAMLALPSTESFFEGEHVRSFDSLPFSAREGQVMFVGDWTARDGVFVTFRNGRWEAS